ncbi:hypothetical protein Ae201684_007366 [Aphanomyces euteiches]|uniref:MORN repeat-containing protein 5 n=1 Tax=Aphanomyces euteiches TaxID=100861 RepID=A0A6G0X8G6_9STRA|nr:hypothetical protein Ae201684_007366 [Aphanomyces euteiches]
MWTPRLSACTKALLTLKVCRMAKADSRQKGTPRLARCIRGDGCTANATGTLFYGREIIGFTHGFLLRSQGMSMQFDGTVFMGEWKNSKRNGWGTCDYAETRDRYEGKWVGDVRCGQGTCTYAAGYVYQGHWAFDKRHGDGRCTYKDGTFYEGHWENNEFCGDGALVL